MAHRGTVQVFEAHRRSYDDPIVLRAGDRVRVERKELWDGEHVWLWCVAEDGREGWVPATYLDMQEDTGVAQREYSALELTVAAGETVTIIDEESGWYWCENSAGERGWVPVGCFDAGGVGA